MYERGHQGMALMLLAPLTGGFGGVGLLMSGIAVATCRLPDLDTRSDWLSHRGLTHTIWFGGLVAVLLVALVTIPAVIVLGERAWIIGGVIGLAAYLGVVSHLLADALTVGAGEYAIRPFAPLSRQPFRLGLVRSNSRLWNGLLFGGGLLAQLLGLAVWYGLRP